MTNDPKNVLPICSMPVGFVVDIVVSLDKHVLLHALIKNDDIKILRKSMNLLYNEILVPVFSENIENYSRTIEYCLATKLKAYSGLEWQLEGVWLLNNCISVHLHFMEEGTFTSFGV